MKTIAMIGLAATVSAAALIPTTSADAQQRVRIYKFCMEESRSFSGSNQTLCRFDTLAQCNASKNSLADRCVLNSGGLRP